MREARSTRVFTQAAAILEINLKLEQMGATVEALEDLNSKILPNMFSPVSSSYMPHALEEVLSCVLHLCHSNNAEFQILFRRFLGHWTSLAASFSINSFLEIIRSLTETQVKRESNGALLLFISKIMKIMDDKDATEMAVLCSDLMKYCPMEYIRDSDEILWNRMKDALAIPEIEDVLSELAELTLAPKAAILCQRDPNALIPKVFSRVSLKYISVFLAHFPVECTFDSLELSVRVSEGISMDDGEEFSNALKVLPLLTERLAAQNNEEQLTSLKPIWKGIIKKIPKCPENVQYFLIHCLMVAEKDHLIELDQIVQFLNFSRDQSPLIQYGLLAVIFNGLSNETIRKEMFQFMKIIATDRDKELFLYLISEITKHYSELMEIDPKETQSVIHKIMVPASRDPEVMAEIFRMQIACKLLNQSAIQSLSEEFMVNNPTEDIVNMIVQNNVRIPFDKLDWFDNTRLSFRVVNGRVDPYFVLELLNYHLIEPQNIFEPLCCLVEAKEQIGPLIFATLFST